MRILKKAIIKYKSAQHDKQQTSKTTHFLCFLHLKCIIWNFNKK